MTKDREPNALADYYVRRAPEYERIYQKPERQAELRVVREMVANTFAGRSVLEVACGTGWWTEVLADIARSVVATDVNEEVLAIARTKAINRRKVSFQRFTRPKASEEPQGSSPMKSLRRSRLTGASLM